LLILVLVPDFRSSTGLFKTLRSQHKLKASGKHLFDAAVYKSDDSTASFHDMVREMSHMTRQAKPTSFHHMLATLAEEGRLLRLYTQNVDGIDTSLKPLETIVPLNPKGPWPKTIQLHGGLEKMVCTKCGDLSDFDGSLFEGAEPPSCKACEEMDTVRTTLAGKRSHGIGRLRPRMVLYNEFNPDEEAIGAVSSADLRSRPDAVIVVGTSLKVPGVRRIAREMCQVARGRRDGFTAWINNGPEPTGIEFKDCWDLVVRGDSDEVARLVNLPKWDDKDIGMFSVVTGQTFEKKTEVKVKIELKNKAVEKTQGIITPTASPRRQSPAPVRDLKKMKQSTLMLSGSSGSIAKTTSKKSKPVAKRPVGRPPKTANINKITNSFTTTKSAKAPGKSQKKEIPESPPQVMAPIFPNLFKPKEPTTMLPISANDLRNNHDSLAHVYKEDTKTPRTSLGSEIEESPSAQLFREGQPRETISPKSIPNGFARLMDC
jgi:NAD-dependent histone deacetylase SIR2